jgi:rhodanese-related sulfurtransferase
MVRSAWWFLGSRGQCLTGCRGAGKGAEEFGRQARQHLVQELDRSREIVALCKMGSRSAKAVQMLQKAGFSHVRNLTGGINAWSDRVDPNVPKY